VELDNTGTRREAFGDTGRSGEQQCVDDGRILAKSRLKACRLDAKMHLQLLLGPEELCGALAYDDSRSHNISGRDAR
jgi:hypothetical protein